MRKSLPRPKTGRYNRGDRRGIYLGLRSIRSEELRNVMRGILAKESTADLSADSMNRLRRNASTADMAVSCALLLGKRGAFPFANTGGTYRSILKLHKLESISPEAEVSFVAGHLNGWKDTVLEIIGVMKMLAELPKTGAPDALNALLLFAKKWGASNYLAKKIAYVVARDAKSSDLSQQLAEISELVDQTKYSAPYFTAVEAIDDEFPFFSGMTNRFKMTSKYIVNDDFRQLLPLHNIIATPVSREDVGQFLRKSHSMSLVDEIIALQNIRILETQWPELSLVLKTHLDVDILRELEELSCHPFDDFLLFDDVEPDYADFAYFRRAVAFTEFAIPCKYRSFIDRIIGPRLVPEYLRGEPFTTDYPSPSERDLTKALNGFRRPDILDDVQNAGRFLRTVWFLLYIQRQGSASRLTHQDIRFIFENTTALDVLVTEQELERLYATVDDDSRPLVTVLALALHKARSNDDDVDFKFRFNLARTITAKFNGSISSFFEWLLPSTPEVANFLLSTLDRPTLQKMYWLVKNPDAADIIRREILMLVGKKKEDIKYFIEADAIEAQRQVSKLRKYFDDSRMYVDGFAMKQWLLDNPTSYTQQYLRLIEHSADAVAAVTVVSRPMATGQSEISVLAAHDYILFEVAKSAFHQFCVNPNFGIESYLGRRIRHNTLTGMMRGGVDSILEKNQYALLRYDNGFVRGYDEWLAYYKQTIETMRREILQFKSPQKPRGIFSSDINFEAEPTRTNATVLRNLTQTARSSELFNELLIRFCWQEIDPQLDAASKYITVGLLNDVLAALHQHIGAFSSDLQKQFLSELQNAVHERFSRLGSWFRQPESGFVSASTRELGDLILMEIADGPVSHEQGLRWDGDAIDLALDGLSVHRMYDCLSVLIRNGLTYGADGRPISLVVNAITPADSNIVRLFVEVVSELDIDEARDRHVARLKESFDDDDLSASMMKEGYSGIKKLRYITMMSEGRPTATYRIDEKGTCTISFELTVERADITTRIAA